MHLRVETNASKESNDTTTDPRRCFPSIEDSCTWPSRPRYDDLANVCIAATPSGGYDFYYERNIGIVISKCDCRSYSKGFENLNIRTPLPLHGHIQCFVKNAKRSLQDVLDVYHHSSPCCNYLDFVE